MTDHTLYIMSGMVQSKLRVHNGTILEGALYYPVREEVERDRENGLCSLTLTSRAFNLRVHVDGSPAFKRGNLKAHFWIGRGEAYIAMTYGLLCNSCDRGTMTWHFVERAGSHSARKFLVPLPTSLRALISLVLTFSFLKNALSLATLVEILTAFRGAYFQVVVCVICLFFEVVLDI